MVDVMRLPTVLLPDPTRVVAVPFVPGSSAFGSSAERIDAIAERILSLTDDEVVELLGDTRSRFTDRHRDIEAVWEEGYQHALPSSPRMHGATGVRRQLLGACFVQEYAYQAAALCNPSMVPTAAEPGPDGGLPFVMSLRAIGEGHISSVGFCGGRIHGNGRVELDDGSPYSLPGTRRSPRYDRASFSAKLDEMGADPHIARRVLEGMEPEFGLAELEAGLAKLETAEYTAAATHETVHLIHWLASSNYEVSFEEGPLSERVISPAGPADSRGIEDARFVRFVDDDGTVTYYATYTAWDGRTVLPQLIQTTDFRRFRIATLNGSCAHNKGMALFPRRIDGLYTALSRHDQESIFLMRSDRPRSWHHAELVYSPSEPWEAIQLGNCGSPLETDAGWLLITHGVGPMRRYVLGALLLDVDDPAKVVARLRRPLLEPDEEERNGYVPNVVYSCGGLIHDGLLVLPYGASDHSIRIATASVAEILDAME